MNLVDKVKSLSKGTLESLKNVLPDIQDQLGLTDNISNLIESLDDDEFSTLMSILSEFSEGSTDTYTQLMSSDYEEIPVSIEEFITNPEYLGRSTDGGNSIYPYWRNSLSEIYSPRSKTVEVILTGAIGIGKTTIAVIGVAYILYKLLCLKSPAQYYKLLEGSKIAIAIFNIDLNHAHGQGYGKLQSALKMSPWFLRHGYLLGRDAGTINRMIMDGQTPSGDLLDKVSYQPGKDIHILVGSKASHFTGYDVFAAFLDEMSFYEKGNKNTNSAEGYTALEIMKVYTAIKRRIESRFMLMGTFDGIIYMISSKNTEHDALEVYASKCKGKDNVYIVDEPVWVVKNTLGRYSGKTFKLVVGDKYTPTKILSEHDDPDEYVKAGREVLDVPIEHLEAFKLDADKSLTDIAGKALVSASRFIDANKYHKAVSKTRKSIFKVPILTTGTEDSIQIQDAIDLSRVLDDYKYLPVYVHIDASKSVDKTGISVIAKSDEFVETNKLVEGNVVRVRDTKYLVLGAISIKAPTGSQIPYNKLLDFVLYLRGIGLRVQGISMDTYQSTYLLQQFNSNNFKAIELSLDRSPEPYRYFKSALYEGRVDLVENNLLEFEFTELIENKMTGKVDHPSGGSKDSSDAVAGAIFNASKSNVDIVTKINSTVSTLNAILDSHLSDIHDNSNIKGYVSASRGMFDELDNY